MIENYIRFETQLRCGNTGRPAGVFIAAGRVEDRFNLPDPTRARLSELLTWFNENLAVPNLNDSDWRCLFWFRCNSQSLISRLWELAYLLEDEGIFVTKVRTECPGMIIYRDKHQVAAKPRKKKHNLRV